MAYKTNWLGGILAPMLIMAPVAHAIQTNMTGSGAHSVFIDNGSVFAMGSNNYGEILPGSSGEFRTPLFMGIQDVKTVAASQLRMAVLKNDGTAVLNGISFTTWANMSNPFPMTGLSDIALTLQEVFFVKDGQLYKWSGDANSAPVTVAGGTNVKSVAAGQDHVVILFNDGTVGTFGKNSAGQLGTGDTTEATSIFKLSLVGVEEITAASNNSYAKLNGRSVVYGWGSNSGNQLGFADAVNRLVPTQLATPANVFKMVAGQSYMALMTGDGSVYSAGWHDWIGSGLYNVSTSFVKIPMPQVDDIGGGNDQVIVKLTGTVGKVSGWGGNAYGKLGDGTNTERHSLTDAYFTPVAPPTSPVVVAPPASEPVVPPSNGGAIMNPLQPQTPPVDMGSNDTSIVQAVIDTVADAAKALADAAAAALQAAIDAAKALADAAAALLNPPPTTPPVVVVTPPPVVTPPVIVPPVVVVKHEDDKDHDNNKDGAKHDDVLGHQNQSVNADKHDDDKKVEVKKTEDKKVEVKKDDDDKKVTSAKDDDKKDSKKKS